jgi:hypothetical protein
VQPCVFILFSGDFSDVEFMFILLFFSISDVFLITSPTMSTQGNPPGEQGSGNRRSSPHIAAKDKGKGKANVPWKER